VHFIAGVDIVGDVSIHLISVVSMYEKTKRVVLLERISFATKGHPAHLPAERIDHQVAFTLAVEVGIPENSL